MNEIETKITNLKKCLYKDNSENNEIDKLNTQKNLFELLRECIKEKEYIAEVGSYTLNVNPTNLSVKYETDETIIEISNEDVYYETTRELELRYFALNDQLEYSNDIPVIEVTGLVTNIDGMMEESYQIQLLTDNDDNIKNYLNLSKVNEFRYTDQELETPFSVILSRSIRKDAPRLDVLDLFKEYKVVPIKYDYINDKFIKEDPARRIFTPNDYSVYLPTLEDKKALVSFIYNCIIEFYTEYINNQ